MDRNQTHPVDSELVPLAAEAVEKIRLAYTPDEAANTLRVSRAHIYVLMNTGKLRFVKLGRRTVIPGDAIAAALLVGCQ